MVCPEQAHVEETYLVCELEAGHNGLHFDREMNLSWKVGQ